MASDARLYVSDCEGGRLLVLALDTGNGTLTLRQEVALDGRRLMPLAISPDRQTLYGALRDQPWQIARLALAADGRVSAQDLAPAQDSTVFLSAHPGGNWLFGACNPPRATRRTGILTVYPLGPGGEVAPVATVLRTPPKLHCMLPDPAGRFVLAAVCDSDLIPRLSFDAATGRLSADGLAAVLLLPKAGPRHLCFHPDGRSLYAVNEYDGSVQVYGYRPDDGALLERQIVSAVPPGYEGRNVEAAEIRFTPDGRLCYVSVRESRTLAGFAVAPASGRLTATGHFATADTPRSFAIDPQGRYLVSAGQFDGMLAVHRIDGPSGALTRVGELPVGGSPVWVEFS